MEGREELRLLERERGRREKRGGEGAGELEVGEVEDGDGGGGWQVTTVQWLGWRRKGLVKELEVGWKEEDKGIIGFSN